MLFSINNNIEIIYMGKYKQITYLYFIFVDQVVFIVNLSLNSYYFHSKTFFNYNIVISTIRLN